MEKIEGFKQIGLSVSTGLYQRWKETGMKGIFVFERGLNAGNLENQLKEQAIQIAKLQLALEKTQEQIMVLDKESEKLRTANMLLQHDKDKLQIELDYQKK